MHTEGTTSPKTSSPMPVRGQSRGPRGPLSGPPLPPGPLVGFAIAILAVLLIAVFSYRSLDARESAATLVTHTIEVRGQLQMVVSGLKDAETGQRGYLLTGFRVFQAG